MKKDLIYILTILALGFFLYKEYNKPIETIEVPVNIEVPVPVYIGDTVIIKPKPVIIRQIDSVYYTAKDKDSLLKDALTIREYREQLDDENVTIDVTSNITGKLNFQNIEYKTKEKTILVDTILQVEVPFRNRFGVRLETGFLKQEVLTKINLEYDMKKWGISGGIDSDTRKWVGLKYNF